MLEWNERIRAQKEAFMRNDLTPMKIMTGSACESRVADLLCHLLAKRMAQQMKTWRYFLWSLGVTNTLFPNKYDHAKINY